MKSIKANKQAKSKMIYETQNKDTKPSTDDLIVIDNGDIEPLTTTKITKTRPKK